MNNSFSNSRNGWGASAADALSTALVMGEKDIVNQIINYVPKINWSVSYENEAVSLFETTIRYVAGLLSGYDLLSGPLKYLAEDVSVDIQTRMKMIFANSFPAKQNPNSPRAG